MLNNIPWNSWPMKVTRLHLIASLHSSDSFFNPCSPITILPSNRMTNSTIGLERVVAEW